MRLLVIVATALALNASAALAQTGTANVSQRVENLEKHLEDLAAKKPALDCITKYERAGPSNNFTPSVPTPAGYHLVGGSCGFDEWQAGDNPTLIQVGPGIQPDGSLTIWRCYGKQSRAVHFTATATFCRVVMK